MSSFTKGMIAGGIAACIGAIIANAVWHLPRAYRQGRIDALNGAVKYELATQPNGERVWAEKAQK